jgi:hypothetical protein
MSFILSKSRLSEDIKQEINKFEKHKYILVENIFGISKRDLWD